MAKKQASGVAALRKSSAVASKMDGAKKASPGGVAYEGDDADLVTRLFVHRTGESDGIAFAVLEFRVLKGYDGQDDIAGQKCVIYTAFEDRPGWRSAEEALAEYFGHLANMSANVDSSDEQIDAYIDSLIKKQTPILLRAKWNKKGTYLNFEVKGLYDGEPEQQAEAEPQAAQPQAEPQALAELVGVPATYEGEQYWIGNVDEDAGTFDLLDAEGEAAIEGFTADYIGDGVDPQPAEEPAPESEAQEPSAEHGSPSDWDGYECDYTYDEGDGEVTERYTFANCNDDEGTFDLHQNGEVVWQDMTFDTPGVEPVY